MGNKKLFLVAVLIIVTVSSKAQSHFTELEVRQNLESLRQMAEGFNPSYHRGNDTLIVGTVPTPKDSLNAFLYYCIKNKIYSADKYVFLMLLKLQKEFITVNHSDYDFCFYNGNGVIDLVRDRTNTPFDEVGCSFFKTYDVYIWIKKNIKRFEGYQPLLKEFQIVGKLLKQKK